MLKLKNNSGAKRFNVQEGSGSHPASCPTDRTCSLPRLITTLHFPYFWVYGVIAKWHLLDFIIKTQYLTHIQHSTVKSVSRKIFWYGEHWYKRSHKEQDTQFKLSQTKIHGSEIFLSPIAGSHVTYSCHHNSSRFTFPIFAHSWRFSVFHSLQPHRVYINQRQRYICLIWN